MIVNRTPLPVLPAQHQQMIPRPLAHQVPGILLIRKPHMLPQLIAPNPQLLQLSHELLQRRAFFEAIEKRDEVVKGFGITKVIRPNGRYFRDSAVSANAIDSIQVSRPIYVFFERAKQNCDFIQFTTTNMKLQRHYHFVLRCEPTSEIRPWFRQQIIWMP
jgi:hypothetical protein